MFEHLAPAELEKFLHELDRIGRRIDELTREVDFFRRQLIAAHLVCVRSAT
ncbi:unnamed protein product [Gemmata massiliana]|uniref:Uncharacterized protein n=1 Tax=Gemmata massiliana TaxID=1210884 RepID=A0A6P2D5G4_9BACT|nr:unnamed protein product [Gemmata massiliana]